MKVTAESTERIVLVLGAPHRVWEGTTEKGVKVLLLVRGVVVDDETDCAEFGVELLPINALEVQGEMENPNDRWTTRK